MPHLTTIRFRVSHPECRCVGARAANVMRIPAMDVDMSVAVLAAKYIFVFKLRVFFSFYFASSSNHMQKNAGGP